MPDAVLDPYLTLLVPLFLQANHSDPQAARDMARQFLESYNPSNARELRLAALAVAFGCSAMDALCKAASPDLPPVQAMRLRSGANALHRSAVQAEDRLAALRAAPPETAVAAPVLPQQATAAHIPPRQAVAATDLLAMAKSAMKSLPPPTRQQRRAAQRMLETAMRREQEAKRQAATRVA